MAMQPSKNIPSFAGQFLKNYRAAQRLTQEQLAYELNIEPRTLRAYENGERQLHNIKELRRIADTLGIEPALLGVSPGIYVPKTAAQIDTVVNDVWKLLDEPRVTAARNIIEQLLADISNQAKNEDDSTFLHSLARVYQVAGYVTSLGTRTSEIERPVYYYHQLEEIARIIEDDTLLNIALTYQGDMFRRHKEIDKAINYLEAARDTTLNADISARGNALQLLGRAYLVARDKRSFERAMGEAEELAYQINPDTDSTRGQYNLAAVYEEYSKNYGILGQPQKALDYISKAEATRPKTRFWETLLMITRAEILIYNGDVASGKPLAIEAARISKAQGHRRRLERIYGMKRHLSRKILEYGKAESELSEVLDGPIRTMGLTAINEERNRSIASEKPGQDTESDLEDMNPGRRKVTKLIAAATGSALLPQLNLLNQDALDQLSAIMKKSSSIDARAVNSLGAITGSHWELVYGGVPKRDLIFGVQGHFQSIIHFLQSSPLTSIEQQLCSIASQQAQIMNEIYFDMHDFQKAAVYSKFSIDSAQKANNPALYAVALARVSFLYTYNHQFKEALPFLQVARRHAEQSNEITICCWIAAMEAEVQANIFAHYNDIQAFNASLEALGRAEHIVEQTGDDTFWTKFSPASLAGYKGVCFKHLQKPAEAQIVILDALNTIIKDIPGGQATMLTDLAAAYAQQGEIEEACNRASQALSIINDQTQSVNALQRVIDFRAGLERWASTSLFRNLDEQIAMTHVHIM